MDPFIQGEGVPAMGRTAGVAVLLATIFMLALPFPSHAGFRAGFVTAFPAATFSRPAFAPFTRSVVLVNPSFVSFSPFALPVRRVFVREVFVREVIVPQSPLVVFGGPRLIVVSQPAFVTPVQPLFISNRCFFDQFNVLRCVR